MGSVSFQARRIARLATLVAVYDLPAGLLISIFCAFMLFLPGVIVGAHGTPFISTIPGLLDH